MFSAGAGVFFPEPEFFLPEPEVKNPEFAQHYFIAYANNTTTDVILYNECLLDAYFVAYNNEK